MQYTIEPKILSKNFKLLVINRNKITPESLQNLLNLIKKDKSLSKQYNIKYNHISNLYAAQYNHKLNSIDPKMTIQEFKETYFPWYVFKYGVMKMFHEDTNPKIKSKQYCGNCLTCKFNLESKDLKDINEFDKKDLIIIERLNDNSKTWKQKPFFNKSLLKFKK